MTSSLAVVSGGFDPVHPGHISLIREAHFTYGDVVIILNSDKWLTRKKGKPFMCWDDRADILRSIKGVIDVIAVDDGDGTVCNGIFSISRKYSDRHIVFCNGGDRKPSNTPETAFCEGLNIEVAWGLGGGKKVSSSHLLASWQTERVERPWGEWMTYRNFTTSKIKELVVSPGEKLSWQRHNQRAEMWFVASGEGEVLRYERLHYGSTLSRFPLTASLTRGNQFFHIDAGEWHQIRNPGTEPLHIIEIQHGELCIEEDIERSDQIDLVGLVCEECWEDVLGPFGEEHTECANCHNINKRYLSV